KPGKALHVIPPSCCRAGGAVPGPDSDETKEPAMSRNLAARAATLLGRLGVPAAAFTGGSLASFTPVTGGEIARLTPDTAESTRTAIARARAAFEAWRAVPAPRRGELVRLLGAELRAAKEDLGALVSIEAGKIPSEGLGEVQEMIDICDFAVGLSRQLY